MNKMNSTSNNMVSNYKIELYALPIKLFTSFQNKSKQLRMMAMSLYDSLGNSIENFQILMPICICPCHSQMTARMAEVFFIEVPVWLRDHDPTLFLFVLLYFDKHRCVYPFESCFT